MTSIKLTVKQVDSTVYSSPKSMLFDTLEIAFPEAVGQDTQFIYKNKIVLVDEPFATLESMLGAIVANGGTTYGKWAMFDATGGKAIGTYNMVDPVTLVDVKIPLNACIVRGFYKVLVTAVSAGADAGTLALGVATDAPAGLKAAIAISDGTNPWDAGAAAALIPVGTAATQVARATAERNLIAVIAAQNFTAGKLIAHVEYTIQPITS